MSFVYAQKIGQSIAIFADTKITCETQATHFFGTETQRRVHQFGLIKNVIVSKNFCICFAGNNIIYANELLQQVKHITLEQLLQIALKLHCRDINNGVEFIICYADGNTQSIFLIKDGECAKVSTGWIGSYNAFNYFQGVRNGAYKQTINSNIPYSYEVQAGTTASTAEEEKYQELFNAFYKTIFDCGDISVGGFAIPIFFDLKTNQFWYKGYFRSFSKAQFTQMGLSMPMYQGPQNGSFSILFYQSPQYVGIYIPENNCGIIYNHFRPDCNDYKNRQTACFLTPHLIKINQLDFYV